MPDESQNVPMQNTPGGGELAQAIDQSLVLHLVQESQMVLQQVMDSEPVWQSLEVYYPKAYQSLVSLVGAFENLTVLLQEANVLHNVEPDQQESEQEAQPPKTSTPKGGEKAEGQSKEVPVGTIREVQINGRSYKRQKTTNGWKFVQGGSKGA